MNGYQITFFTKAGKRQAGKPMSEWLLALARELGLRGVTVLPAQEGWGRSHRQHSAHFFELSDAPLEVVFAVSQAEHDALFARLRAEGVHLFYVKTAVEFGAIGEP